MPTYSKETIAKDVRIAIDENETITAFNDSDGTTVDPATLELDDMIVSKIAEAVNLVRMVAPLYRLELTHTTPTVSWLDQSLCIGIVRLPADFLRLALFKMSDWPHGVAQAITPASPMYRQQFSKWGGVRGNASKPVIAFSCEPSTGEATIEFFSCASTAATAELSYVERIEDEQESYEIENPIYRAVVYKTASLVMSAYGNAALSQAFDNLCLQGLGIAEPDGQQQ